MKWQDTKKKCMYRDLFHFLKAYHEWPGKVKLIKSVSNLISATTSKTCTSAQSMFLHGYTNTGCGYPKPIFPLMKQ